MLFAALEFPPISHLLEWPTIIGDGPFAINKVVLGFFLAVLLTMLLFVLAARQPGMVPTGAKNMAMPVPLTTNAGSSVE